MRPWRTPLYVIVALLAMLALVIIAAPGVVFVARNSTANALYWLFTAALAALAITYSTFVLSLLRRTPTTLSISLLGLPGSGKTVYLTVLFHELATLNLPGFVFAPYGAETVEHVEREFNTLTSGRWLPPTAPGQVFFYRAVASLGSGAFRRRYKIEIGDYAGQRIGEFVSEDERWLHKTDYFKYVIQSDAVLLAVDCETIVKSDNATIKAMESAFIAALHLLIENKGVEIGSRLKTPVALVFMKSDLVPEGELNQLQWKLGSLISTCRSRCSTFEIFITSAVGHVNPDGSPPAWIDPKDVTRPIIWILRQEIGGRSLLPF